jgi:hypothetical protein
MFYFSVESQFSLAQIPIRLCQIIKFLPGFLGKIARITQIHQNPSKSIKILPFFRPALGAASMPRLLLQVVPPRGARGEGHVLPRQAVVVDCGGAGWLRLGSWPKKCGFHQQNLWKLGGLTD